MIVKTVTKMIDNMSIFFSSLISKTKETSFLMPKDSERCRKLVSFVLDINEEKYNYGHVIDHIVRKVEMSGIMAGRWKEMAAFAHISRRNKEFKNKINILNQAYLSSDGFSSGLAAPKKSHRTKDRPDLRYLFYF